MQNYEFKGRFSTYAKELCEEVSENRPSLFSEYVELYMVSALYGLLNDKFTKYNQDVDGKDPGPVIREAVFINASSKYLFFRQTMIISETKRGFSAKERIDYALRFDMPVDSSTHDVFKNQSKYDENTEIINGYVLGGLEALYNKYHDSRNVEDLITDIIDTKKEFEEDTGLLKKK